MKKATIPGIILLVLIWSAVSGQHRSFEHLTVEDGLANNSVRALYQDKEGYLWFGTLDGLSRYDGKQFRTFAFVPGDSTSISNNKIRDIFQDSAGYLWVSTYNDHVHRFDPRTEVFIDFPGVLGKEYQDCAVSFLYETSPGIIWLKISGKGCVRMISGPESPDYSLTWFNTGEVLPSLNLNFIRPSGNGAVWAGTSNGLAYFPDDHLKTGDLRRVRTYLAGYDVLSIYERKGSVWIGCRSGEVFQLLGDSLRLCWKTPEQGGNDHAIRFIEPLKSGKICIGSSKGLLLIDETTGEHTYLNTGNSTLVTDYIVSCFHDSHDDLWLVTDRRGVIRFRPGTNEFAHYELRPELRQSIMEGEKQVFLEDHNGDVWLGLYGGGISRYDRNTAEFEQFLHDGSNPGSLSSNLVLSVFEDRSGNIWAGTYKRGLNKIRLRQSNFHFKAGPDANRDFSQEVRAIFEDGRKWIWTGNKRGELVVYDQKMRVLFTGNDIRGLDPATIGTGIYAFEEDRDHNIWIGTKGNGIFVIKDLPSSAGQIRSAPVRTEHLYADISNPNSVLNNVFDLHLDRLGQMWVALYHGGISVIQNPLQPDQRILKYRENENDRFSLSDDRVRCIHEDKQGNIWIGTANGLNFLPSQYRENDNKRFQRIGRTTGPDGISHQDIINIFEDSGGNIWFCTYGGGLNKLVGGKPGEKFSFERFTEKDGLPGNLVLGMTEDNNHSLWIHTDFGLCRYNPGKNLTENFYEADGLEENAFSEATSVRTTSGLIVIGDISGMVWFDPDSVRKSAKQVPVVLTGLQINGEADRQKLNLARLTLGDSLQSLKLSYKENFLTIEFAALDFTAPEKIRYMFMLENYEENWNPSGNVNKAIYRDLQPGTYRFRLKASNSDGLWVNPELWFLVTVAPPPWKTGWAYCLYLLLSAGLFLLIRRIVLERIKLKHEVEFEKKLTDDKLRFYTSISHEFKTPLALIMGPVDDLLCQRTLPPSVLKPLRLIRRNTQRLLELIDQLMDFRKIQKGFFRINPVLGDLVQFLDEIYQTFVPLAEKQQIRFSYNPDRSAYRIRADFKTMEKIVFNLLSNAFKHTGAGRRVELELSTPDAAGIVQIRVSDEGEGIREQDLPHIFERFSLAGNSRWKDESGTGIGLSLIKELVELLQGTIQVESSPGKGSCFTVMLPVQPAVELAQADQAMLEYAPKFVPVMEEPATTDVAVRKSMVAGKKILIVEDNPDLRSWLAGQLASEYLVVQAENGEQGLQKAQNENPDLIVCDIMMPGMDGLELTRCLKNEFRTSHIPVILLTARSLEDQKIEGIETGADDYITKPFNMRYLQTRIGNILKQRAQLRERYGRDLQVRPDELAASVTDQEFLRKVVTLIEANMADSDFSVDSMLKNFSFGRTVFYRKMKGITGYAPKDFVRIVRMKKAAALLQHHDLNVSEVAYEVGFNDPEYFSQLFKKHFGMNPSEYQKRKVVSHGL